MSIKNMSKDELELLSYKDITNLLLEENGAMNTKDLFKEITTLLELPSNVFEKKIADYYTTLTTDKRFVLLDDGTWDLRVKHKSDKVLMAIEEDVDDELEAHDEDEEEITDDIDGFDDSSDTDDFDDSDDDLKDLVIMDEDELELEQ